MYGCGPGFVLVLVLVTAVVVVVAVVAAVSVVDGFAIALRGDARPALDALSVDLGPGQFAVALEAGQSVAVDHEEDGTEALVPVGEAPLCGSSMAWVGAEMC